MNEAAEPGAPVRVAIGPPKLLTPGALLGISAYGLLIMAPVLGAILVVSVVRLGILSLAIPLVTVAVTAFFLPIGLGNPLVAKLIRPLRPAAGSNQPIFAVQLSLTPRIHYGLRALIEDADDVGWLTFTESSLEYRGDSVTLSVPFSEVRKVQRRSIGWRGLFLYGPRISLVVAGLPGFTAMEFAERSSCLLPGSRKTANRLCQAVALRTLALESKVNSRTAH